MAISISDFIISFGCAMRDKNSSIGVNKIESSADSCRIFPIAVMIINFRCVFFYFLSVFFPLPSYQSDSSSERSLLLNVT